MEKYMITLAPKPKEILVYAPNTQSAIKQAYIWMGNHNYDGDVISVIEADHAEREFMDTEIGEILTEDILWADYEASETSSEATFMEYINNCCAKNGTLQQI